MKFISWNVNGLRACVKKGFIEFFQEEAADFFCIQETKLQEGQIELELEGYFQYWNYAVKKGYSGTAIFTKHQPLLVNYGMDIAEHDQEGRVITLEYEKFYLVNVYTPNSKRDLLRLDYRIQWEQDFRQYLSSLEQNKPVILCGDLNVAHQEIDLTHPKSNVKNSGFTKEERAQMTLLLEHGFIDSFRYLNPTKEHCYTWWSYQFNARSRNIGWRIDYFILSRQLAPHLKDSVILPHIQGSDHCPVAINLEFKE